MSSRSPAAGRSAAVPFLVLALVVLAALAGPVRAAESDADGGNENPGSEEPPAVDLDLSEFEAIDALIKVAETTERWSLDDEVQSAALRGLLLEIAVLQHLDAFRGPQLDFIADIHDAYGPWPAASHRAGLNFLLEVDDALAETKIELNEQVGAAPAVGYAFDTLSEQARFELGARRSGVVDAVPYARALNELFTFGNAAKLAEIGAQDAAIIIDLPPVLANPLLAVDIDALRLDTGTAPVIGESPSTETDGSGVTVGLISGVLILGFVTVGLVTMGISRRRRRQRSRRRRDLTDEVFEAHRRLSTAHDESEIAQIVERTAVSITGADAGLLFRTDDGALRQVGGARNVRDSVLDRVAQTAQPLVAIAYDDPAVATAAICAVPLVSDGRSIGVLVTRRPHAKPFDDADRRRLEMLAPAVGGALVSADRLDSFEQMALIDGLTSLGNRRRLDGDLETTLGEAVARDLPVAFAMIDVDHFKQFNDTHGHEAGDRALQAVAQTIADTVRAMDVVYRYGGEEFSVLLPGATLEQATIAAERVRAAVEAASIEGEDTQPGGRLTVSVGVSTLDSGEADNIKLRADRALYDAKAQGRNRSVVA